MRKHLGLNLGKIAITITQIPLWFVKMFHDVGHLPSQENPNEILTVDFYHSMYENIGDSGYSYLAYLSFALIALTVITSALGMSEKSKKKAKTISNVLFFVTVAVFAFLLLMASTVGRGY